MIQTLIRWGIFRNPHRRWTRMLGIKIHMTIPSCDIFGLLLSDSYRTSRLFCFYFVYCCVKHRKEHKSGTKTGFDCDDCWNMLVQKNEILKIALGEHSNADSKFLPIYYSCNNRFKTFSSVSIPALGNWFESSQLLNWYSVPSPHLFSSSKHPSTNN